MTSNFDIEVYLTFVVEIATFWSLKDEKVSIQAPGYRMKF